jgi:hypothetical protein
MKKMLVILGVVAALGMQNLSGSYYATSYLRRPGVKVNSLYTIEGAKTSDPKAKIIKKRQALDAYNSGLAAEREAREIARVAQTLDDAQKVRAQVIKRVEELAKTDPYFIKLQGDMIQKNLAFLVGAMDVYDSSDGAQEAEVRLKQWVDYLPKMLEHSYNIYLRLD